MAEMNEKVLKDLCRDLSLYSTPHINDKLYLHYKVKLHVRLKFQPQILNRVSDVFNTSKSIPDSRFFGFRGMAFQKLKA